MKQLLFLLLFPCLALAQYQGNANQKITLGEQTTADGLVWRGRSSDTANLLTNKLDTSVYIVLDTGTRAMWYYRASTTPKWTRLVDSLNNLQGQLSLTSKVTGVLPVANGGTNTSSFTAGSVVFAGASGTSLTQDNSNLFWNNTTKRLGIGTASPGQNLTVKGNISLGTATIADRIALTPTRWGYGAAYPVIMVGQSSGLQTVSIGYDPIDNTNGDFNGDGREVLFRNGVQFVTPNAANNAFNLTNLVLKDGNVGIGTASLSEKLHVVGNGRFTAVGAGTFANNLNITSDGTLTTSTSDEKYKYNILPINYGLNTILQLKPINFQWIEGEEQDLGFIAQDVADIIPEAVNTNWNSDLLMRYESLIPILTKAIQEQQVVIKALEQRILNLENK